MKYFDLRLLFITRLNFDMLLKGILEELVELIKKSKVYLIVMLRENA